ncbi:MAG: DUF1015 domain-containing protein [Flavobacteriaceae bacterium]|nr:DUF1015 domain-containing protein [Flavobacteriaceae bacterium]
MATVKPFRAVRATRDKVALVSSKSYEAYTPAELGAKLDFNPFTFLHIINPGYKYHREVSGKERFKLVHNRFIEFKENKIFTKDEAPAFYIYKKVNGPNTFCGIIAAASVEDYNNDIIKKHEGTIKSRERLFQDYLKTVGFNAEPVLLTYPDNDAVQNVIEKYEILRPEYEFSTTDKRTHYLWLVTDSSDIKTISVAFAEMEALYIADGHHRSSSSCLLAEQLKMENDHHSGVEPYNYFMSYLIPESHLKISEFNRLVKDLNGLSKEEFLIQLDEWFRIDNKGQQLYRPSKKHHFSMYLDGEYYSLYLRKSIYNFTDALSELDAEILYRTVLKPILGIKNLRKSKRIHYSHGKNDAFKLKSKVDSGKYKVAFGLVPATINQLKAIADAGLQMPPKSTYIEPKLRSGLTMYEF